MLTNAIMILMVAMSLAGGYDDSKKVVENAGTVEIGEQVWMSRNLDVAVFRNGDLIPEVKGISEMMEANENMQPAWCYYDNDPAYGKQYGKLYNWYAVNDPRGLAPEGWRIPGEEDWAALTGFVGKGDNTRIKVENTNDDGSKQDIFILGNESGILLKSTSGWEPHEGNKGNGNNKSGFNGLPAGYRSANGTFEDIETYGGWWSATENDEATAWFRGVSNGFPGVCWSYNNKGSFVSVRCVKDKE